jgi:CheY-like chemotaxis protein
VTSTGTAREALDILAGTSPDVLLCDIGLPDVDGYELIQRIRELDTERQGGGIPAIALTAYARSEDRTRAFRSGYQAHLAKPVELPELLATVSSFASWAAGRRARPPEWSAREGG